MSYLAKPHMLDNWNSPSFFFNYVNLISLFYLIAGVWMPSFTWWTQPTVKKLKPLETNFTTCWRNLNLLEYLFWCWVTKGIYLKLLMKTVSLRKWILMLYKIAKSAVIPFLARKKIILISPCNGWFPIPKEDQMLEAELTSFLYYCEDHVVLTGC